MNQPIDSTFIPFPTPSAAAPHAAGAPAMEGSAPSLPGRAARGRVGQDGRPGGAEPAEDSPGGGAKRGRPSGRTDRVVAMMKDQIRRHGFSDTKAAQAVGVSSTSISRWKKNDPELVSELLKAQFDCRIYHLEIIENAAAAENGRGWRASAWMLERLFPGDYAPKMAERFAYMNLEDKIRDREESALLQEDIQIRRAEEKAERARAAAAAAEAELEEARAREGAGAARSREASLGGEPPPLQGEATPPPADASCIYSEGDSRNSRNSGAAEPGGVEEAASTEDRACQAKEPGRPRPEDPNREAAHFETRDEPGADEPTGERAASPSGSTGRGRPGSLNEAAPAAPSMIYSEGDSRNSRNSAAAEPGAAAEAASTEERAFQSKEPGRPRPEDPNREAAHSETRDEPGADEPTGERAASPSGSTGRGRPGSLNEAAPAAPSMIYSEGDSRNSRNCPLPAHAARPCSDSSSAEATDGALHLL